MNLHRSRITVIAALALALATAAVAVEPPPLPVDEVTARAAEVLEAPHEYVDPAEVAKWKRTDALPQEKQDAIQAIATNAGKAVAERLAIEAGHQGAAAIHETMGTSVGDGQARYALFISFGMPEGALASAVDLARRDNRVTLILRGTQPGETINALVRRLAAVGVEPGGEEGVVPPAEIDPPRFRREHIEQVPVLVREQADTPQVRVRGLFNPDWLEAQAAAGHEGDLGQHGPTYAITEEDMEERVKTALAKIDLAATRREAMEKAWATVKMIELPAATRDSLRTLDPTITASQTLFAPDGEVIVEAGHKVNPLVIAPLHTRLVIFDPRYPEQVEFAIKQGRAAPNGDVMYLFTRLADTPSWQAHGDLAKRLGRPAYLFVEAMRERFGVRSVPTVIDAVGAGESSHFEIREHHLAARKTPREPADADADTKEW